MGEHIYKSHNKILLLYHLVSLLWSTEKRLFQKK